MFFIIFVLEAFGVRKGPGGNGADALIINAGVLFVLLSIGYLYTDFFPRLPIIGGGQNLLLLILVVFIVLIFWFAYKSGSPQRR